MRKVQNKPIFIAMILFAIFACCALISHASNKEVNEDILSQMSKQEDAVDAYNDIIDSMERGFIDDDIYAGAYVEGSKIVIMLTDVREENKDIILSATDKPYAVKFIEAEYSLKYLKEELEHVVNSLSDYPITEYGLYEKENKCYIKFEKSSYEQCLAAIPVSYSDDPFIIFESGTYNTPATQLVGGMAERSQTIGFCGRYGTLDAIVTSGHKRSRGDEMSYGTIVEAHCENGKNGDFAIIAVKDGYTLTNRVYSIPGTVEITTVYRQTPIGALVLAYGRSGGFYTGKVVATDVSINYIGMDIKVTGQTRCEPVVSFPRLGDSGGPIYRTYGNSYGACGVFSTLNTEDNVWTFCIFRDITKKFAPLTS